MCNAARYCNDCKSLQYRRVASIARWKVLETYRQNKHQVGSGHSTQHKDLSCRCETYTSISRSPSRHSHSHLPGCREVNLFVRQRAANKHHGNTRTGLARYTGVESGGGAHWLYIPCTEGDSC